jgi:hypothetical protein
MNPKLIQDNYSKIHDAACEFLQVFGPSFSNTEKGHIATDIAATGAIAGLTILRETIRDKHINIQNYKPGDVILSEIHEREAELFTFLEVVARSNNYSYKKERKGFFPTLTKKFFERKKDLFPEEYKPLFETIDLNRKTEENFLRICQKYNIESILLPFVALLTGYKLINAGEELQLIDSSIGKKILDYYIAAGCHTVPY